MKAATLAVMVFLVGTACASAGNAPYAHWRSCTGTKGAVVTNRSEEPVEVRAYLDSNTSTELVGVLEAGEQRQFTLPGETRAITMVLVNNPGNRGYIRRDIRYTCSAA